MKNLATNLCIIVFLILGWFNIKIIMRNASSINYRIEELTIVPLLLQLCLVIIIYRKLKKR